MLEGRGHGGEDSASLGEHRWGFSAMGVRREKALWAPPPYLLPGGLLGPPQPPTASYPERHVGPSGSRVEAAQELLTLGRRSIRRRTKDADKETGWGKESREGTVSPGGMPVPIGPTVLSQRPRGAHPAAPVAGLWAFSQGPGLVPQSPGCPALAQDVHPKAGARQLAVPKPEPTPRTPATTRSSLDGESA